MILSFPTDRSVQKVQTLDQTAPSDQSLHCLPFRLHLWTHYSVVRPCCSKFRVLTANFSESEFVGFLR